MAAIENKKTYPQWWNFPVATLGGAIAWTVVHPMDMVKVRMQMRMEAKVDAGLMTSFRSIIAERGILGIYDGLSAGISRQMVYTTCRLGCYDMFRDAIVGLRSENNRQVTMMDRVLAGAVSGGFAAFLSCPVDVAMVRMQADASAPIEKRRNYKNAYDALSRIYREEGALTFWRGSNPTVFRASVVGITQVGFYDQCKSWLVQGAGFKSDSLGTFVSASLITGLFYSFVTMPIETVKVRMQNQKPLPNGMLKYRSMSQALSSIAKTEGIASLWKGYLPYYGRCGFYTLSCFFVLEQCKKTLQWSYNSSN
ncbi:hypothetical protein XU18_2504 [Perkinsela sp. CCAP 1560/4]|nr:hypothetical protein XU18_2504 [Perkinsela sp. CCAP 1560/4]|eukprot:KNH06676.1 hypothetical protein XU18_2504 [Perkinsela sp. CCAP 1560/4]